MQARGHGHLFERVEQRGHRVPCQVGVGLDQEVGLVEIEIASDPFEGLIVEKADDYLGHAITYSTNPHLAGVLRTARRPRRREHLEHVATCLRTASAWLRRSLPAR